MGKHNKRAEYKSYRTYEKEIPMKNKNKDSGAALTGCGVVVAIFLLIPLMLFITPLILMLTWNLAVCALFPALPTMSYWVAFGVNWFLGIIGNKFSGANYISTAIENLKDENNK